MPLKFKDASTPSTSKEHRAIDWSLCALCQTRTSAPLIIPARRDGGGYNYISANLEKFQELGESPINVDLALLNEGNGFAETFRTNTAGWHKLCRQKVSTEMLQRATKRHAHASSSSGNSPVKTRKVTGLSNQPSNAC
jgi:hypothetical protein